MTRRNGSESVACAVDAFRDVARVGDALVVATPRVAASRVSEVVRGFVRVARSEGLHPRIFGLSVCALRRAGLSVLPVGREPLWRPRGWLHRTARRGSLREQVRRARAKGMEVRRCVQPHPPEDVRLLAVRWLASRGMAPMGFAVRLRLGGPEGTMWLALREGRVVAFAQVRPMPERGGWLIEHLVRDPARAPNGWAEALIQDVARAAHEAGVPWISLGLAPLDGAGVPSWMRGLGHMGRFLFDFEGLAAFKARLRPDRWVRRGLGYPLGEPGVGPLVDTLRAFAGGSLWRFGVATARHQLALRSVTRGHLVSGAEVERALSSGLGRVEAR